MKARFHMIMYLSLHDEPCIIACLDFEFVAIFAKLRWKNQITVDIVSQTPLGSNRPFSPVHDQVDIHETRSGLRTRTQLPDMSHNTVT